MLRRTFRFCGGGHDHGMPTTKEAAHLVQQWVLSRPVPPPPGKGKRYASFIHPGKVTGFQLNIPDSHETKIVDLHGDGGPHEVAARTRLSARSIQAVVNGLSSDLSSMPSPSPERKADTSPEIPKKESVPSIRHLMQFDPKECNEYLHKRGGEIAHRLKDYNPNGYEREAYPWDINPPPAPKK